MLCIFEIFPPEKPRAYELIRPFVYEWTSVQLQKSQVYGEQNQLKVCLHIKTVVFAAVLYQNHKPVILITF